MQGAFTAVPLTGDRSKLPVQFTGDWCIKGDDHGRGQTYRFGSCNAGWLTVSASGFDAHEMNCKLVRADADESSNYLVKFVCSGNGENWTRRSLDVTSTSNDSHRSRAIIT